MESSWFEKMACKRLIEALEEKTEEFHKLEDLLASRTLKLTKAEDRYKREHTKRVACEDALKKCQVNNYYYAERIDKLLKAQAEAILIPDVSEFFDGSEIKTVKPFLEAAFIDRDMVYADLKYYAFTFKVWESLLKPIQALVKKKLKKWRKDIADCDNWALTMASFVALAFDKSGLDKQGAFMVTWSRKHAYNAFLAVDGKVWIYEPQNGEVIGLLEESEGSYDTEKIWFPAEAPE